MRQEPPGQYYFIFLMISLQNSFVLVLTVTMMSSPTSITYLDDLFEEKYFSKIKQSLVASFPFLLTNPFIGYIVFFVKADIDQSSWLYLVLLIHYFPLFISKNIMSPLIEQATFLNSIPSGS